MSPDPYDPNDHTTPSNRPYGVGGPSNNEIWNTIANQQEAQRGAARRQSPRWFGSPRPMSPTKARWMTAAVFATLGYLFASANDGTPIAAAAICGLVGYFFRAILAIIVAVALMAYWIRNS